MTTVVLDLGRRWTLGDRVGGGGFGQVYAASDGTTDAAAKLIPKQPGAERELLFVDLAGVRNVVPVIDSGEYDDQWVLVMPRAEHSLRDRLNDAGGALSRDEAMEVVRDVTEALVELDGKVVHRDLKPENVLLLDGHWCLADFGISRYAEASTAPDTRKYALSPPYAAPERWRNERATTACDIYALGVIAYEVLSGELPFRGPTWEDFREQHLHRDAPEIAGVTAALAALVGECLYKSPQARPAPANVHARLRARAKAAEPSPGLAALAAANQGEVQRRGTAERRSSEAMTESERRQALADDARRGFGQISSSLKQALIEAAPAARVRDDRNGGWVLALGGATLTMSAASTHNTFSWGNWNTPAFDLISVATINLKVARTYHGYEGRSHSLWYGDIQAVGRYGWFETAFMISPLIAQRRAQEPFALDPGEPAAKAVWAGMAEFQVAWPFTLLDHDQMGEFISRWAGWVASGSNGGLNIPGTMPERPVDGTWRTS